MNLNNLRHDGDLILKVRIILVVIYCVLFILSIVVVDGSLSNNLKELLLQVGKVIYDLSPSQVTP